MARRVNSARGGEARSSSGTDIGVKSTVRGRRVQASQLLQLVARELDGAPATRVSDPTGSQRPCSRGRRPLRSRQGPAASRATGSATPFDLENTGARPVSQARATPIELASAPATLRRL